ncbi:hypothetical protein BC940DRAFT_370890 [Gongronella butleri]|nr:hypothetical protein BC940DRAFT_370890 [Gongronella butleri]
MTEVLPPSDAPVKLMSRFTEHFDIVLTPDQLQPFLHKHGAHDQSQDQQANASSVPMALSSSTPGPPRPMRMNSTPAMMLNNNASTGFLPSSPKMAADQRTIATMGPSSKSPPQPLVPPPLPSSTSTSNGAHHDPTGLEISRKKMLEQQRQQIAVFLPDYKPSAGIFYRGDHMVKRLSNWLILLKLASGWTDEISRLLSTAYYKKMKKERHDVYDRLNKGKKQVQAQLSQYKRECREQLHDLKTNPALRTEELLTRANQTKKCLRHLAQLCDYADDPNNLKVPEKDPWLGNLLVLRYLKRETTEENRLRALMAGIQKEMHDLETQITETLAVLVDLGVEMQTTITHYGTTVDTVLGAILPYASWNVFVDTVQQEWVDENHIEKNYLKINYPNKMHPLVATAQRGVLGRRAGVLKQYHKKYYILTHYGFLHQYKMNDRYKPEGSILVAGGSVEKKSSTDSMDDDVVDESRPIKKEHKKGYFFDVRLPKKSGKTLHFCTKNKREWEMWCRRMAEVTSGQSVAILLEKRERIALQQKEKRNGAASLTPSGQPRPANHTIGSSCNESTSFGTDDTDDDDDDDDVQDDVDAMDYHDDDDDDDDDNEEERARHDHAHATRRVPPPPAASSSLAPASSMSNHDDDDDDRDSHFHSIDASMRSSNTTADHMHVDDSSSLRIMTESDIMSLDVGQTTPPSINSPASTQNNTTAAGPPAVAAIATPLGPMTTASAPTPEAHITTALSPPPTRRKQIQTQPQQPNGDIHPHTDIAANESESGIYFSSTSSVASDASPPPMASLDNQLRNDSHRMDRHGAQTYQPGLNLASLDV